MLVRLMYASRSTHPGDADELAAILRKSRQHNPGLGITGVLCFSEGIFLQVLEGGRMNVSALYHRITQDARHRDVVLLSYVDICERCFTGWSMGQVNLNLLNPALLLKYSEKAVLDPYAMSGAVAMALFNELVATASITGPG